MSRQRFSLVLACRFCTAVILRATVWASESLILSHPLLPFAVILSEAKDLLFLSPALSFLYLLPRRFHRLHRAPEARHTLGQPVRVGSQGVPVLTATKKSPVTPYLGPALRRETRRESAAAENRGIRRTS